MTTQVLPDVEAIALDWLHEDDAAAAVRALVEDRISDESGSIIIAPYLTVSRRAGGARARHHLDQPVLEVEGWADDRATARDVCATAVAALHDMTGSHELGVVSGVTDLIGPRRLPSREDERHHFGAEVLVRVHAHAYELGS